MSESAFRFLLQDNKQPFRPSRCYIIADPKVDNRKLWSLELAPPKDALWVYELDDLKDWMLHGSHPVRRIFFDIRNPRTPFRELERDEVFREYLRKLLEKLPAEYRQRRKYALMPSIEDDKARTRYKDALEAAIPEVTVIPEPEMVAEYFRLLKGTLKLEIGANNVILVVDVGASTANMSVVLSRRDQTIVGVDQTGAQRDLRVRALRGDSLGRGGRWVDKHLAEILRVPEGLLKKDQDRDIVLRAIEEAKVRSSRTGTTVQVEIPSVDKPIVIDRDTLVSVSETLANELKHLFQRLCERLYDNQTSSDDARRKSEERLRERSVSGPADAYRLVDVILLAGGTTLLPGFQDAMLTALFPGDRRPEVLPVGSSFAIAAAAGGLAHILHSYDPPRLRAPDNEGGDVFQPSLESTLAYPVLLGIKQASNPEQSVTVLDPNDPFIDDGGRRPIQNAPALAKGSHPKMRLVPGEAAGVSARQGRRFQALRVLQAPGRMEIEWDPSKQRATIHSDQVEGTKGTLWIDVNTLRKREEASADPFDGPLPAGALAVDRIEDIVLDIGMSKVVALAADRGWVSSDELERVVREGLDTPVVFKSSNAISARTGEEIDGELAKPQRDLPPRSNDDANVRTVDSSEAVLGVAPPRVAGLEHPLDHNEHAPPASTEELPIVAAARATSDNTAWLDWGARIPDAEFSYALEALREAVRGTEPDLAFDDIVVALLALAVRPIVLLAGPPGCGKSTLVRTIARVLGKEAGKTFHEIPVQAHWEDDSTLFAQDGLLSSLFDNSDPHLVLFDEFNLTRPEYYLSRLFSVLDGGTGRQMNKSRLAPCRVFGTMNIDDSSRPPSPKIIDRCFLLELTQVSWDVEAPAAPSSLASVPVLPGLPAVSYEGASTDERVAKVMKALSDAVADHDLRHDLLPSRRALADIKALLGLHHRLDLAGKGILNRDALVDRVLASRILVKLSGAFDQLEPALIALETTLEGIEELPRTRRRLKLARQQARLGFISPWQ